MQRSFAPVLLLLAVFTMAWSDARGQTRVSTDYTDSEIIAERAGFAPGETTWFALRQEVREKWHVFWVNPGDAGLALELDWSMPAGYRAGAPLHPVPDYIPVGPLASYAHEGTPVFLIPVTAPSTAQPGETVEIEIEARWQACEMICVPEEAQFAFSLPVLDAPQPTSGAAPIFADARAALPVAFDGDVAITRRGDGFRLTAQGWPEKKVAQSFFFPELEGLTTPAARQRARLRNGELTIDLEPGWTNPGEAERLKGLIRIEDKTGAPAAYAVNAAIIGSLAPGDSALAAGDIEGPGDLAWLLALSFFGGVILNAMPCVFPVIFIKATTLAKSAAAAPQAARRDGAIYMIGVLTTFMAMGGVLTLLRAGGEQLGWGFHLQSPLIVGLSAYVLFAVGLNLAGLFTVGERLAGSGEGLARRGDGWGSFFTGALAVVVAAPCIGPLLSAPMGAALMQPAGIGLLIFALMGLGLAAPYAALSFMPQLGRILPKPGPWMKRFKQILAFPVFLAALYFVWVLTRQTENGFAIFLTGAALIAAAGWMFEASKQRARRAIALRAFCAIAILGSLIALVRLQPSTEAAAAPGAYGAIAAEPYSAERLKALRQAGTPVFIDFTAAWCVTCQVNKITVLSSAEIGAAFEAADAVLMVGDWTVRDPEITAALESYGAAGVPLYVFYPAGGEAQILPQALSKRAVLDALIGAS